MKAKKNLSADNLSIAETEKQEKNVLKNTDIFPGNYFGYT